jgi:uncharacterized damage-inducible protein DinB
VKTPSESPALAAQQLIDSLALNKRVMTKQVEGLTHADSLQQPPFRGNCLNWVLGHIAVNRNHILTLLGEESIIDSKTIARYDTGSDPVRGDDEWVLTLEELGALIDRAQDRIETALSGATANDLDRVTPTSDPKTTQEAVRFRVWHETYHVGQTEYLRQLAGTNDHVI